MATEEDTPTSKSCSKCGQLKPLTAFYKHPHCKYGRAAQCKACETVQAKAADRRLTSPPLEGVQFGPSQFKRCTSCGTEKLPTEFGVANTQKSGLAPECRDCFRNRVRKFRSDNREHCRKQDSGYRLADPVSAKARSRKWYRKKVTAHPGFYREGARVAYLKYREKRCAYSRKWAKDNPNRCWARLFNRRSLAKVGGRKVPAKELLRVRLVDSLGICSYCNGGGQIQIDHIEPLTKGGLHELENFAPACNVCNLAKRNTPLLVWLARRALRRQTERAA